MKDSRINYIAVGSFVLLVIAGFIITITMLTGRTGAVDSYYTTYPNVGGIKYGTQVLFEGYPIGQVEKIIPEQKDKRPVFKVILSVKKDWKIPQDSVALVAASGLLSAISIDIKAGTSETALKPKSEIKGNAGGNIFAAISDIAGEVSDLSENGLKPLLKKIESSIDNIAVPLAETMPVLLKDLKTVSNDMAENLPLIMANLDDASSRLNSSLLSKKNEKRINETIANIHKTSSDFTSLSSNLDASIKAINTVVKENKNPVNKSLQDLQYTLKTLARHIDSITYNLDGTARNMSEFSRQIRQNPALLLGGTPPEDEAR
ncbi:MAG: MCE family protein [Alphaproteobacteria bacterium]|nr:MCE family protein [Alphaproteobacteria bacterium]